MGVLRGSTCYATQADADASLWSSVAPAVDAAGHLHILSFSGSAWVHSTYDQAGVLVSSVNAPALASTSCDPADYVLDGAVLGFAVIAVWLAAAGVLALRKALGVR